MKTNAGHFRACQLRRTLIRSALLLYLAPLVACGADGPSTAPSAGKVAAVLSIELPVANLERSIEFFAGVLTFERVGPIETTEHSRRPDLDGTSAHVRRARLRLGEEQLDLTEYVEPKGRPFPADSRGNDRWFQHIAIIVSDMDHAHAVLQKRAVRAESRGGPQTLPAWNSQAAGIRAFYFRDPDGHFLEILQFPAGKGDPKWHRPTDRLFLGIDHTAIVVADTQASLRFYRDGLGLQVVGGSENYGPEQERLNNVPGARLRITTLRAAAGPGIELLQYLHPTDGRPAPLQSREGDLWRWFVHLGGTRPATVRAATATRVGGAEASGGSVPAVSQIDSDVGPRLNDPDGHAIRFHESRRTGP